MYEVSAVYTYVPTRTCVLHSADNVYTFPCPPENAVSANVDILYRINMHCIGLYATVNVFESIPSHRIP